MTRTVVSAGASGGGGAVSSPSTGNWASGTFGTGLIRIHGSSRASYTFTVPTGITSVRVRVWGAGGGGCGSSANAGGGGGGFAIGEFDVVAGTSYAITVGQGGAPSTSGGTSSFGSLISATGGAGQNDTTYHEGGVGQGGYANYYGGGAGGNYCGGGGSASLFGHGTPGIANSGSGNTGAYGPPGGGAGGGFGYSATPSTSVVGGPIAGFTGSFYKVGDYDGTNTNGLISVNSSFQSIDTLGTGSGGAGATGTFGVNGGGGGREAGSGGWPGGGGGTGSSNSWGSGADGCVIVEY